MEVEELTGAASGEGCYLAGVANQDEELLAHERDWFWGWALVLLCLSGSLIFFNSSLFSLRQVIVKGNRNVSAEEIVLAAGIGRERCLWRVNFSRLKATLVRHPFIAGVQLIPLYPDRLMIMVRERQPLCRIRQGKREWVVGNDLVVLGSGLAENSSQLAEVVGLSSLRLKTGMVLRQTKLGPVRELIEVSPRQLGGRLRQIDLNRKTVLLEISGSRMPVTVLFGDFRKIGEKTALLRAVLARDLTGQIIGIDLRIPGVSTVTTAVNIIP